MKKGAASLGHHLDRCAFSFWRIVFEIFRKEISGAKVCFFEARILRAKTSNEFVLTNRL